MTIMHYAIFPKHTLSFPKINSLRLVCVFRMCMQMGVEQFINDFKETGSVITLLALKECENK